MKNISKFNMLVMAMLFTSHNTIKPIEWSDIFNKRNLLIGAGIAATLLAGYGGLKSVETVSNPVKKDPSLSFKQKSILQLLSGTLGAHATLTTVLFLPAAIALRLPTSPLLNAAAELGLGIAAGGAVAFGTYKIGEKALKTYNEYQSQEPM